MSRPRLERRKYGVALVTNQRLAPFGYVREGKLRMKSGDDNIEFTPDDLRRLAGEIEGAGATRVVRLISARPRRPDSQVNG